MAKEYRNYDHTHVVVDNVIDLLGWGCNEVLEIIHHTGKRVWIRVSYAYELPPEILRVGDGTSNGFDEGGDCIVSVPAEWCEYYTKEEVPERGDPRAL